jgi:hypothetical protein
VALTDPGGRAEVALEPGSYCLLAYTDEQVPRISLPCKVEVAEGGGPVELSTEPAAWVVGQVRDASGPVAGAKVRSDPSFRVTFTDAQGRYRLGPLLPGEVRVLRYADGDAELPRAVKTATARSGEEAVVDFVEEQGGGTVAVTVRVPAGLEQVAVQLMPGKAKPGAVPEEARVERVEIRGGSAAATFRGLAPGTYTAVAVDPEGRKHAVASVDLAEGQTAQVLLDLGAPEPR